MDEPHYATVFFTAGAYMTVITKYCTVINGMNLIYYYAHVHVYGVKVLHILLLLLFILFCFIYTLMAE